MASLTQFIPHLSKALDTQEFKTTSSLPEQGKHGVEIHHAILDRGLPSSSLFDVPHLLSKNICRDATTAFSGGV
jgi:hypothetical protein